MTAVKIDRETLSITLDRILAYDLLAALFSYPDIESLDEVKRLLGSFSKRPFAENIQSATVCDALIETLEKVESRTLEGQFNALFTTGSSCPPCETEYEESIFTKTAHLADIAGFYRACGLETGGGEKQSPDHAGCELEFVSYLGRRRIYAIYRGWTAKADLCLEIERRFLVDHLGRWFPVFCRLLMAEAKAGYYAGAAQLGLLFIEGDLARQGLSPRPVSGRRLIDEAAPACQT